MDNKQNSKFKGFYSYYLKDNDGKVTQYEKVFDDYESYINFIKEKGNDFFIDTKSFFDKNLLPTFGKFLGIINDGLYKGTAYINNTINNIEKPKNFTQNNKLDIVSNYRKELELEKQKKYNEKNILLKQKDELLEILKEFKELGNDKKVEELENIIKDIENQLNSIKI